MNSEKTSKHGKNCFPTKISLSKYKMSSIRKNYWKKLSIVKKAALTNQFAILRLHCTMCYLHFPIDAIRVSHRGHFSHNCMTVETIVFCPIVSTR